MVTIAKEGTLAARRQLIRHLGSSEVAGLFMDQIAPRFTDRNGGYTRVLKMGNRPGDGAQQALLEFSVPIEIAPKEAKPKKEKKPKAVEEKKVVKAEKEKPAKKDEKEETEKRGGFLSKLRKFLKGSEE
jgi:large subunit ribosomal protein L17